jgi:hypothetical protein
MLPLSGGCRHVSFSAAQHNSNTKMIYPHADLHHWPFLFQLNHIRIRVQRAHSFYYKCVAFPCTRLFPQAWAAKAMPAFHYNACIPLQCLHFITMPALLYNACIPLQCLTTQLCIQDVQAQLHFTTMPNNAVVHSGCTSSIADFTTTPNNAIVHYDPCTSA